VNTVSIEVSNIGPSPFQHRRVFETGALRELAKSIERDGLIQPITVRPITGGMFELIAGERRWRAIKQFTELITIEARVLVVNDLQARRLCATENMQRVDLNPLEEVLALAELVDASLLEFSEAYAPIGQIQEPKWRVRALLTKLDSDRKHGTNLGNKFVAQVVEIFSSLPKPREWQAFHNHDLPLLFTTDQVWQFAFEHRLNKSQTRAFSELHKTAPVLFKEIVHSTPNRAIARLTELASNLAVAESQTREIECVRDLSAETIRQATKNFTTMRRQQAAIVVERSFETSAAQPVVVATGDWWQLGRHRLYCGDTSKPEFHANLPQVDFAFADPPYGVKADWWDESFYWEHDWLITKAPIVAVTPGQPAMMKFFRKTTMPYHNSMASWITNGHALSEFGYQNWIYLAFFARDGVSVFRQCQDVIRCTIDTSTNGETNHRGRKPAEMIAKILELYCPPSGVVIDPFLGSGTTLLVAEETGRSCIGGELSPTFCWKIIQRWGSQTGKQAVKISTGYL